MSDGRRGLGPEAFRALEPGERYEPYVSASERPAELTPKAIVAGIAFGVLFGAANAYLGLRAGLTISTSIPVAVMTVAAFRLLASARVRSTILEHNAAQTVGSASSSIASGVIFTLPALFLWGLSPSLLEMTILALAGGILGVLFMIPLRRFLIEREHGALPYPEGTACAEVLVAADVGGDPARNVFRGLAAGALFKLVLGGLRAIPDRIHARLPWVDKGQVGLEASAALFGVGYILGPRVGAVMVGGGLLSWVVGIPAIAAWGEGLTEPLFPETVKTIAQMSAHEIWSRYVRYIGAGAVATAGILSLVRNVPLIGESFRVGLRQLRRRTRESEEQTKRTDRDLPTLVVVVGVTAVILALTVLPQGFVHLSGPGPRLLAAVLVAVGAFFFVTVSSRIVGLVGVTSNPTSGMTIATLLGTAAVFLALGWTGLAGQAAALTVGCVVAIAASVAGDTSQDLKTGFLVGATPRVQQTGELLGVLTSAAFVCLAVLLLDRGYGFGTAELPAPQATLMKLVIEGVLQHSLPWAFVGIGVGLAVVAALARIPALPFAVGVYLPLTTMVPVFLGGALRWWLERRAGERSGQVRERGILFGSGLVGGEGLLGVGIAAVAFTRGGAPEGLGSAWAGDFGPWLTLMAVGFLAWMLARATRS